MKLKEKMAINYVSAWNNGIEEAYLAGFEAALRLAEANVTGNFVVQSDNSVILKIDLTKVGEEEV